mmetsp:Transcript_29983/g.53193  ORF Transcript_29983/g.53193 Transcript_29983/m.53193 type:complete len:466 (-) Transcript_29983:327-1724(-)
MNKKPDKNNCFDYKVSDLIDTLREILANRDNPQWWVTVSEKIKFFVELLCLKIDKLHGDVFSALGVTSRLGTHSDSEDEMTEKFRTRKGLSTLSANELLKSNKFMKHGLRADGYFKQQSALYKDNSANGLLVSNLRISNELAMILETTDPKVENFGREPQDSFLPRQLFGIERLEQLELCKELSDFQRDYISQPMLLDDHEQLYEMIDPESDNSDADFHAVQDSYEPDSTAEAVQQVYELTDTLREFLIKHDYNYHNKPNPSDWAGFEYYEQNKLNPKEKKKKQRPKREMSRVNLTNIGDVDDRELSRTRAKDLKLSEASVTDWKYKNFLPKDYRVSFDHLTRMFSRPQTQIKRLRENQTSVIVENFMDDACEDENSHDMLYAQPGADEIPEEVRRKEAKSWRQSNYIDMRKVRKKVKSLASQKGTFMEIVDTLPQDLDDTEKSRMSYSLCFVTLLHLAEKNRKA